MTAAVNHFFRPPPCTTRGMPFPLIQIIIALVVVGLILWVIEQIPMDAMIQKIIRVVVVVCVCLWLLSFLFGAAGYLSPLTLPR